jgi:hypothetical protein
VSAAAAGSRVREDGDVEVHAEPGEDPHLFEQHVQPEPQGEIEDDADDGRGDGGERGRQRLVLAQALDVGRAEEDPQEARREGHPGGQRPPSVPATSGGRAPASRNAPMKPTNWVTMMSGPGVVSAMPRPSSISPGASQP